MSKRRDKASGFRKPWGAQRLDEMVVPIARPALKKYGFHEFHLFEHWSDIVGPQLAMDCVPVKLSRAKGRQGGATLVIRAAGYRSLELQHSIPQIMDRLNRFLGGNAISRIKLVQGPVPGDTQASPRKLKPLTTADRDQISDATSAIQNETLKRTMQRLGENVRQSAKARRDGR